MDEEEEVKAPASRMKFAPLARDKARFRKPRHQGQKGGPEHQAPLGSPSFGTRYQRFENYPDAPGPSYGGVWGLKSLGFEGP